ncbi:MAG: RagB/SusD family nutrient uptake outer membrane protein [Tannerellaceae bacterium]|jgi:tetratricopeptide (TPR) repeat protein|nr:RagB/SusD family nutrient uptake outer membrane protein [Tannerellaceae bacterium]
MKIKIFIGNLLLLVISSLSCSDFLEELNPNTITVDEFWKTESDFNKGLMATYNTLEMSYVMGGANATSGHVQDDITIPSPWGSGNIDLNNFQVSNINPLVTGKWQQLYRGIFRANQVLEQLDIANLSESFKIGISAETRFLRGLFYFWLASNFNGGNIPIFISVPKTEDEYYKPLSPKETVYNQIIEDLKFAQTHLPKTWDTKNMGRATWGAATGILGQMYLYEKKYEEAKNEFKTIINSDIYKLVPEISWNFDLEHEHNSESIFEVNFSDVVKKGEGTNHSTNRASQIAPQEAGGGRAIEPAYNFIELCKQDPIDPANPINKEQTYSQRALATICFKGDGQIFYQRPSSDFPFIVNQEAHIKKFQNWTWTGEPVEARSGINERVLRLADVYLMYAETIIKTTGDISEAIDYINRVRERSGVLKLDKKDYDVNKLMIHLMRVERPLELAYEGHMIRWQDIKRWGIGKELFEELSIIKYRSFSDWLRVATPEDLVDPTADIRTQFVESARNYNPEEDDYFPIPNQEIITNNKLSNQ